MPTTSDTAEVPRYRPLQRRLDRWRGRRDGKRGLPTLPADLVSTGPTQAMLTTPYMLVLLQRHDAFRAKLRRASADTHDYEIAAAVTQLTEQVEELTRLVAEYPADPIDQSIDPGFASFTHMSDEDVERERRRQHELGRRRLRRKVQDARSALSSAIAAQEKTLASARGAIDEHAAHIRERLFVYLDAVVTAHPDGSHLQWWLRQAQTLTSDPPPGSDVRQLTTGPRDARTAIEGSTRTDNPSSTTDEHPTEAEDE